MAKPAVVLVGADKGGVGKTTVARVLLDYFVAHNVPTRAFDTEAPKGSLKRFHPDITDVVDITSTADQMKIFDTLASADAKITVIDIRAGQLSKTLEALRDIGFLDAAAKTQITFTVFHVLGPSIASLEEIRDTASFMEDAHYILVKNFINNTTFFEWDPATYNTYSRRSRTPTRSPSRSSTRWPASRWSWPPCPTCRSSPTRRPTGKARRSRSCCAAMCATGSAMSGPSSIG
jgi:hypothetical protein